MKEPDIRLGMIILMESDLEAAVEFYKKLGFQLKFHVKNSWAEFKIGDIKVGLCPTTQAPFDHHSGIVLEVKNLNDFYQKMKAQGIEFIGEPKEAVHGLMLAIKDPSGNIIDLYEPTPEKVKEFVQKVAQTSDEDEEFDEFEDFNTDLNDNDFEDARSYRA